MKKDRTKKCGGNFSKKFIKKNMYHRYSETKTIFQKLHASMFLIVGEGKQKKIINRCRFREEVVITGSGILTHQRVILFLMGSLSRLLRKNK